MKYAFTKVALISPQIISGAVNHNKTELMKAIVVSGEKNPEIILSARLSLSGYSCGSIFFYQSLLQGCIDALAAIVNETQNLSSIIVVGMPMKMANKIYDCSAVIHRGSILCFVPHNSDNAVFSDFPNGEVSYIKVDGQEVPFGKDIILYNSALDYSIKFSDSPFYLPNTEIILRPLVAVKTMGSKTKESCFCKNMSHSNICAVLSVGATQNSCDGEKLYDDIKIICELGNNIGIADPKNPEIVVSEIDIGGINHAKAIAKCHSTSSEYNYLTIDYSVNNNDSILTRNIPKHPYTPGSESDCNDIIDILTTGIQTKLSESKHEKIIFGLSGGLDSTHVLMLCYYFFIKNNLPIKNIIAVTMPTTHTSKRTAKNAVKLIELLQISTINVPISSAVKKHLKDIDHDEIDVVYENAQARERTQILLDLSNKHNALLLGTSDLSELCLGFGTYGGDLIAHYNPNGWLTKTAIRYIIKYFTQSLTTKPVAKVLNDILKTPISPELLDNQQTEEILGAYEVHDFYIHCLINKGYDVAKTLFLAQRTFESRSRKELFRTLQIFIERFFKYRFKHNCCCDSPVVIDEAIATQISNIKSGISSQLWQKDLSNLKMQS